MARYTRLILSGAVVLFCAALASGQVRKLTPQRWFPPEVVISPGQQTVEVDNSQLRASRATIPAKSILWDVRFRQGLLVAVTDVHVRLKPAAGASVAVQLGAGQTRWVEHAAASVENLGGEMCEFLFVEGK